MVTTGDRAQRRGNLKRLLNARHVVLIGGGVMAGSAQYCRDFGFEGVVDIINPHRTEIEGFACRTSLDDLDHVPDAAVIGVPRQQTVALVADLARRGVPGTVCFTAGFAEVGDDGAELQRDLTAAAGNMALIGPNCVGAINYFDRVPIVIGGYGDRQSERGVAVISQSGVVAQTIVLNDRDLPVGYMISLGNQAVIDLCDCIDVVLDDTRVNAIGLYLEGLGDIQAFASVAMRAAAQNVPIVVLKSGTSPKGAQAIRSHTASLAGSDTAYDAFFERFGVVRAPSLPCLIETLKLFAVSGAPPGETLGVLTVSGADCSIVSDLAERRSVDLPTPSRQASVALNKYLGDLGRAANPLDFSVGTWRDRHAQQRCFETFMTAGHDTTMLVSSFPLHSPWTHPEHWDDGVAALIGAKETTGRYCLYAAALAETVPAHAREALIRAGIAPLQGLEEALDAFALATRYGARQASLSEVPLPPIQVCPPPAGTGVFFIRSGQQGLARRPRLRCSRACAGSH